MSGPGAPVYLIWSLRQDGRGCEHPIPVPRPIHAGIGASLTPTPDNPEAAFVCPECGLATLYSLSDLRCQPSDSMDQYQADKLALVYTEVGCADKNCRPLTNIHVIWDVPKNGTAGPISPTQWKGNDTLTCGHGHPLKMPQLENGLQHYYSARMPF